ncbi:hypothetical protein CYMTET_11066 [Cymbomonas tetramitiformis]|uniref:Cyclopropane-fatty-acyl-phospholipid synthase n=1 Tax=Cymbomonas tetramitiformis TaxID=36881 RepID=A0AAE0GN64_9CHLO|nr:hypothetical protein CYMTET_11066 [Cymbomonas tetramitiformis]
MVLVELGVVPDFVIRRGVRYLLQARLDQERRGGVEGQVNYHMEFLESVKSRNIAEQTDTANEQHYEVPTAFYTNVMGKHYKYSCCLFRKPKWSPGKPAQPLTEAEEAMLTLYETRAQLEDGQKILELGCGWGSLCLWIAAKYPNSKVTAVSNSRSQKQYIMQQCVARGLSNLEVITADINDFSPNDHGTFDRCLSIEMFEHMKNYKELMRRVSTWLKPGGMLFVHIFVHRSLAYHFEAVSEDDWMSKYFFSGGTMPSDSLLLYFQEDLRIMGKWAVNGEHYALTSEAWLAHMDDHKREVMPIMEETYGPHQKVRWFVYWRLFFIAVAEMFAWNKGEEWYVSHYLFEKP